MTDLLGTLLDLDEDTRRYVIDSLSEEDRAAVHAELNALPPMTPAGQALVIDAGFRARDHLQYLSDRLALAVSDVEAGQNRKLAVSMPPRMGKSTLSSMFAPVWMLRKHPDWRIALISHAPSLAASWGRSVRRMVTEHGETIGVKIASDAGAVTDWETTERGGITSRSIGQSITGLGFRVMLIDDAVKDYAAAHSDKQREAVWEWWTANAVTRLEPPSLVIVVGTRWHQDDLIGRLLSDEHDGDPAEWEEIRFPALAEENDVLGREPGDPLLSPVVNETPEQARERWRGLKRTVGSYTWAALYQQSPVPAEGAVFQPAWWRYWTTDPEKVTADGKVRLYDPRHEKKGVWLDSWDCTFKGSETSDYVVGQRWVRTGADRFLVGQVRRRMTFSETLEAMRTWAEPDSVGGTGEHVARRVVEEAANGAAIIDTLQREIAGMKAVKATASKEARARAVTPEIESGNVYLPHPTEPGYEWVQDLLDEVQLFPSGKHDDQVDALSQGLSEIRPKRKEAPGAPVITVSQTNYWSRI